MAGKKKKQATSKSKLGAAPRSLNNTRINNGATTQASSLPVPSSTKVISSITSSVVANPSRPAVGKHDTFFVLPPELRDMVYSYVFTTGTVDKSTNFRVIVIGERRELREGSINKRKHDYKTENFKSKQLSMIKVCKQMNNEIMAMIWHKTVLRFTSTLALARFVGHLGYRGTNMELAQRNVALLRRVKKIECEVGDEERDDWHLDYLQDVNEQLDRPLALEFFDTISPDSGEAIPSELQRLADLHWRAMILERIRKGQLKVLDLMRGAERRIANASTKEERRRITREMEAAIRAIKSTYKAFL